MKKSKTETSNKKKKHEKIGFTLEELFANIHEIARTMETNPTSRGVVESSRKAWERWCGQTI